jgi:hypothetical protein
MTAGKVAFLLGVLSLHLAPPAQAQIISEALTSFPSRIDFIEYDNLAQLRVLPDYETLRQRFSGKPLEQAKAALSKLGIQEDQVDELVLGTTPGALYGILAGTFSGELAARVAVKHHLLPLPVEDNQIYCPGSGTCIAFLEDNIAAFGNPTQLQTMIETRLGLRERISANRALSDLMNSTQSRALVRAVALGNQIHSVVESALPDLSAVNLDWSALSSLVTMFAYSIDIDTKAHVTATLICTSAATTFFLRQMLTALSTVQPMEISSSANTIEVKLDTQIPHFRD